MSVRSATARGLVVPVGHDRPDVQRHAVLGADLRRAHREPVQREHAGDGREQAGPVRRGDGHRPGDGLVRLGQDLEPALVHQPGLLRRERRRWRGGPALEPQPCATYQLVHEPRLPLAPGRGPGGPRVRHGQGGQQLQRAVVADRRRPRSRWSPDPPGRAGSRCRPAAGAGRPASSRVSTSSSAKPRRVATVRASRAPAALWSTPSDSEPLPMSCSSAPTSSRSGRDTSRTSGAARTAASSRCRSTLKRCTALRCGRCRTRSHSGQQAGQQPGLVEGLPDRDQLRPGAEQVDEELAGVLRPGLGQRRGVGDQAVHRARRQRQPGAGGAGRHPQHEQRVGARVGLRREHGLAVVLGQPGAEQPQHRLAAAHETGPLRPGRLQRPPPGHVGGVRHRRRGPADGAQQVVGVADPEQRGDRRPAPAARARCDERPVTTVQRVAHVGEQSVPRRRPSRCGRSATHEAATARRRHQVAQPAAALLEVGLEVVAQVAVLGAALVPHLAQLGQPAPGRGPPVGEHAGAQPAHQRRTRRPPAGRPAGRAGPPGRRWPAAGPRRRCGRCGPAAPRCPRPGTRPCRRGAATPARSSRSACSSSRSRSLPGDSSPRP